MQRRLLRTITVTVTITERWSVVYQDARGAEAPRVQTGARTLRRQSVSMTIQEEEGQVLCCANS
jgi:hypothetical protein